MFFTCYFAKVHERFWFCLDRCRLWRRCVRSFSIGEERNSPSPLPLLILILAPRPSLLLFPSLSYSRVFILTHPFSTPGLPSSIESLTLELFSLGYPPGFHSELGEKLGRLGGLTVYSQPFAGGVHWEPGGTERSAFPRCFCAAWCFGWGRCSRWNFRRLIIRSAIRMRGFWEGLMRMRCWGCFLNGDWWRSRRVLGLSLYFLTIKGKRTVAKSFIINIYNN